MTRNLNVGDEVIIRGVIKQDHGNGNVLIKPEHSFDFTVTKAACVRETGVAGQLSAWAGHYNGLIDAEHNCGICADYAAKAMLEAVPQSEPLKPRLPVGVSVLLTNEAGELLLGERRNNSAAGMLSTPGGRLEENESIQQCAVRELLEETGVHAETQTVKIIGFHEHFRYGKHYIMIYVHVADYRGEVTNTEPDKCAGWAWHSIENIPLNNCTEPQDILKLLAAAAPKPAPEVK